MTLRRLVASSLLSSAAAGLAGCFTARPPESVPAPVIETPPQLPSTVPDAVPKYEPKSRYGNPPSYEVFGKRYYVLSSSVGYVERGVASWYGPGFHKVRTSAGEPYDMYAMTAAHKTLPLPAYVRVTNLQNGRSVVVRVNDRGPFVSNRIIDLSYTAAAKLDMLRNGTALVEIRSIDTRMPPIVTASNPIPGPVAQPPTGGVPAAAGAGTVPAPAAGGVAGAGTAPPVPATAPSAAALTTEPMTSAAAPTAAVAATPSGSALATPSSASGAAGPSGTAGSPGAATPGAGASSGPAAGKAAPLFIQAGAFSDPANAEGLAVKLRGGGFGKIFVRDDRIAGRRMYRVRIGPIPNVAEFDRVFAALERAGISDAHLALD